MTPDELIERHLDGLLAPEEAAELDRLLAERPDVADAYARRSRRDDALRRHFAQEAGVASIVGRIRRRRLMRWGAAAVALLVAGGALLWPREDRRRGPETVRYPDGTTLVLLEGAEAVLRGWKHGKVVELSSGELEADVRPQKTPMLLRTPDAEASVVGTRFTLAARRGATRLDVQEGAVALRRRDEATAATVKAGQAATTSAVAATRAVPAGEARFRDLYRILHDPKSGYFSRSGVPYHSVETLVVDAPDHGHLSTSETFSYWLWLEAVHGRLSGDWEPFRRAWAAMERAVVPSREDQPTNAFYKPDAPHTIFPEKPRIEDYPVAPAGGTPGTDALAAELKATYGTDDLYLMHWLVDPDDWYGFGRRGERRKPDALVNTFQRGPEESVWETIPHPSWEDFSTGGRFGYFDLFVKDPAPARQWRYVSAPDAEARAIQAAYWASQWAKNVPLPIEKAKRMGDALRYALRDRHFTGVHGLIGWSFGWGGAIDPQAGWAWRLGAGHVHFGYQNPVAAWALSTSMRPSSPNGGADWARSLERQLELYRTLQSEDGPIAGGGTVAGETLTFQPHPVFHDPPSNEWFGWQAWSMDRLCQYLLLTADPRARDVCDRWAAWARAQVRFTDDGGYAIPATLRWEGRRAAVSGETQDVGVAGALARALVYHAKATGEDASRAVAKELLDRLWRLHRDPLGVACPEARADYARFFEKTHIPDGWTGPHRPGATFLDLRPKHRSDPDWPRTEAALRRGEPPVFRFHRFWAQVEVALALAEYARLFP